MKYSKDFTRRFCLGFIVGDEYECWEWTKGKPRNGYGIFYFGQKEIPAHRIAYELYVGPIASSHRVKHFCKNRRCVNPKHLFVGIDPRTIRQLIHDPLFVERFESKFEKGRMEECWEWQASINSAGYGSFSIVSGNVGVVHQISYELYRGPIPKELCVCHTCDNPPCVNPNHLFLGTINDNNQDKISKGRDRNASCESHGNSKLTNQQVREIRGRYKRTSYHESNKNELAIEFGISPGTVKKIVRGSAWSHLP